MIKFDKELYLKNLKGMIPYATVSKVNEDEMDSEAFFGFHKYLEETYPLLHKTFKKEILGKYGLLYHWKGNGKSDKLPLLLTAHQDVVPEGDHSAWKYPPYEGVVAEGLLWGRGTTDSKCNIQAYMDALELLIAEGFAPEYDIYLSFGYNEEIMGGVAPAARIIVDELKNRNVSLGLVIDECGGVYEENGQMFGEIIVGEKGYADFEYSVVDPGGHSAGPAPRTGLGYIAEAICAIEANPLPQTLTPPIIQQYKAAAPYLAEDKKALYSDPEANWEKIKPLVAGDRVANGQTRTTIAVSMAGGSAQANILPERAWAVSNSRLVYGYTIEELQAYLESIVPKNVKVKLLKGHNPSPMSSVDTYAYRLISSVMNKQYPGIKFIPCYMSGGTDARYYYDICPTNSVYRFTGMLRNGKSGGAHQVNEHIDPEILPGNVQFYYDLISNYADAK